MHDTKVQAQCYKIELSQYNIFSVIRNHTIDENVAIQTQCWLRIPITRALHYPTTASYREYYLSYSSLLGIHHQNSVSSMP